jgi:TolB-like protein
MQAWLRVFTAAAVALSGLVTGGVARAAPRPTVAILYFDYSGNDEGLGVLRKGLAQMMISDLSALDAIQLVERDRLEEILAELRLGQTTKIDAATAAKAGKLLGARYMVLGGYFDLKGALRVDARVVEVETGKVVQSVGATGDADDFLALEQKLVGDVGAILDKQLATPPRPPGPPGQSGTPGTTPRAPRARPPARLARHTAVLYSRALNDIDAGNKARAKETLKQVVKEQADFKLAMLDLDKLMQ